MKVYFFYGIYISVKVCGCVLNTLIMGESILIRIAATARKATTTTIANKVH